MITTNVCYYCTRAKNILNAKGLTFTEIDANQELEVHLDARNQTGWRTVPIIWDLRSGEPIFVGGSDELILLLNQSTE
ncbi:MAG: glutaredoxin [Euryarchaeota archaeon TMED85]|nr:MAG: glutaredoxin [Euryarchaeota archaeon]RPG73707.1 MAG: glutaredoxin [Euryarchaeota archaeon TMED85]